MLILTRKPGEMLYVGDDITFTVLGIQGRQVKLGIEVPEYLSVYREEIYNKIAEQNKKSLMTTDVNLLLAGELWKLKKKDA